MGKDYWYWSGSRSSRSNKSSKKGGSAGKVETADIPTGCMCAVFQAFDFHPFHFSLNQHHHQQQQPSSFNPSSLDNNSQDLHGVPKGAEAPRNSLESEDGTVSSNSLDEKLKIPKNIRIKTSGGSTRARGGNVSTDVSSELISSPGTKTPTLVARLMGLDLLPDALHSSSSSSSSCISTPNQQGYHHLPHIHHHLRQRQHDFQLTKHRNSTGSYNNNNNASGTRYLHETPRSSDVEHRRLSLQINKENLERKDMDLPRFSFSKRKCDDENFNARSPSHYARQIVKQVKESVSRKVGVDITNTVKSREKEREEFVTQLRLKKSLKKSSGKNSLDESNSSPGKHSNSSYSPRLSRFMDTKHKTSTKPSSPLTQKDENTSPKQPSPSSLVNIEAQVSRVLTKAKPQALPEQELQDQKPVSIKCKKNNTNEKFSSRLNKPQQKTSSIRKKQEEAFVIRPPPAQGRGNDIKTKSKRTHHPLPTSNVLINDINTSMVPNLLPVKMDPSPPATKIPQKQSQVGETRSTQLSSCSSQRYKQEALSHTLSTRGRSATTNDHNKSNGVSTSSTDSPEFKYIATILSRTTGPHNNNLQWFSASHPLDPSIFHKLELYPSYNSTLSYPENYKDCNFTQNNHLGPRSNRRLLFDLVDEVLSEILVMKKPKYDDDVNGMLLLERVWKRVLSFPRAKCEVLEDIDRLIEINEKEEEEERREREEGMVVKIEEKILETLVHETVTVMVGATV
ncbi:hypothetical protein RIF29_23740 [Crotalaria pallida]|uniref:DUF4378 domain-containing protein n=1 Tax=Crotalaria pallida TaxID=3830 RepID=A0AAN9FET6_CROPI